jgi:hypothetical protein
MGVYSTDSHANFVYLPAAGATPMSDVAAGAALMSDVAAGAALMSDVAAGAALMSDVAAGAAPWDHAFRHSSLRVRGYADGGVRISIGNRQSSRAILAALASS